MLMADMEDNKHERELEYDALTRICKAVGVMRNLLDDLLELSRIGRIEQDMKMVCMNKLAANAGELLESRLHERGIQLTICPNLPKVFGHEVRLQEVYQNLIDNAVKYMTDKPGGCIEAGARNEQSRKVYYVRDNGLGIDPEYCDKVFNLFAQLDNKKEGTGVGLAIVKRIIEMHGGQIWVESQGVGEGATFCVTLPDAQASGKC